MNIQRLRELAMRLKARKIPEQVASLLDYWAGGISSGVSTLGVIRLSIQEVDPAMRHTLRNLVHRVNLGVSWREAFESWEITRYCPEVSMLGVIIEVNDRMGTDLSTALKRVAQIIRMNQKIKRELEGMTIQSRLTCCLLVAAPPLLLAVINVLTPEFLQPLWYTSAGHSALVVAAFLQITGVIMVYKLTKVKWLI